MKRPSWLLSLLLFASLMRHAAYGQGTIVFNNLGPNDGKVDVFDPFGVHTLLTQDLNFSLSTYRGNGTVMLERTWLLSDSTAKAINVGPGLFADPSHSIIVLGGIPAGEDVTLIVSAWDGNYPTFIAAASAGFPAAQSTPFLMTAGSAGSACKLGGIPRAFRRRYSRASNSYLGDARTGTILLRSQQISIKSERAVNSLRLRDSKRRNAHPAITTGFQLVASKRVR